MKLGVPRALSALSNKTRWVFVPEGMQFEASDHDMCIKTHLIISLVGEII